MSSDSDLKKRGLKFRDYLTQKFKWDFTSEPDDYAPTVVDLEWIAYTVHVHMICKQ